MGKRSQSKHKWLSFNQRHPERQPIVVVTPRAAETVGERLEKETLVSRANFDARLAALAALIAASAPKDRRGR